MVNMEKWSTSTNYNSNNDATALWHNVPTISDIPRCSYLCLIHLRSVILPDIGRHSISPNFTILENSRMEPGISSSMYAGRCKIP